MLPTIFPVSHQAPLSGNKHLSALWQLGLCVGLTMSWPLPLPVFFIAIMSLAVPKHRGLLLWLAVWSSASVSWGVCAFICFVFLVLRRPQQISQWFVFLLLPFAYKFLQGNDDFLPKIIVCMVPIFFVNMSFVRWSHWYSILVSNIVLVGAILCWFKGDVADKHRVGILGLWIKNDSAVEKNIEEIINYRPTDHDWILSQPGQVAEKVALGWHPENAILTPFERIEVGRALDQAGRRGEAYRLLWKGRKDPMVAWTYSRLLRLDEHPIPDDLFVNPPDDVLREGHHILDTWWFQNKCQQWYFHLTGDLGHIKIQLLVDGTSMAANITTKVDNSQSNSLLPLGRQEVSLPINGTGAHSLEMCFTNDTFSSTQDINVQLLSIGIESLVVE